MTMSSVGDDLTAFGKNYYDGDSGEQSGGGGKKRKQSYGGGGKKKTTVSMTTPQARRRFQGYPSQRMAMPTPYHAPHCTLTAGRRRNGSGGAMATAITHSLAGTCRVRQCG